MFQNYLELYHTIMLDTTHALTSSLSDEALASLLQDLPAETPIPTYPDLTYPDFLVRPPPPPMH